MLTVRTKYEQYLYTIRTFKSALHLKTFTCMYKHTSHVKTKNNAAIKIVK